MATPGRPSSVSGVQVGNFMPAWLLYRPRPEPNPASKNGVLLSWERSGLHRQTLERGLKMLHLEWWRTHLFCLSHRAPPSQKRTLYFGSGLADHTPSPQMATRLKSGQRQFTLLATPRCFPQERAHDPEVCTRMPERDSSLSTRLY